MSANITPLGLTVNNPTATSKSYDGNANIAVSGTLATPIGGDDVSLNTTGTVPDANVGAGKTVTLSLTGANAGNYSLTQPSPTLTANITALQSSWSGTGSWSTSGNWTVVPNVGTDVTVASGELIIDNDQLVNSITISPGAKLTLASGKNLTVNNFTINSDVAETGTYKDNGTTTINGTVAVNQYLTGLSGTSGRPWWYVSSPVSGATSAVFDASDGINKLWNYAESTNPAPAYISIIDNSTTLNKGVGYVAYLGGVDATYTFSTSTGDATKKLNSGDINLSPTITGTIAEKRGFNLIGNPYPSFLDWNAAYAASTNVRPTIWYRTNTTATGINMQFDTFDGTYGTSNGINGTVNQYIPPMQAFWVKVDVDNTSAVLGLTNSMRSHQDQTSATNRLRVPEASTAQVLRLKVSNGITSDEALVVTNPNATDGYDSYDSPKMTNANAAIPEIYTFAGDEETVINNLNCIIPDKELALGFRTGISNIFSIKATQISNFSADTEIILKDNMLNTQQDITDGTPYVFHSDVTDNATRFSIIFKTTSVTTGINSGTSDTNDMFVYKNANNHIVINRTRANGGIEGMITVCNAIGQKLISTNTTGSITVINQPLVSGVYFVSLTVAGNDTTKKIIIN